MTAWGSGVGALTATGTGVCTRAGAGAAVEGGGIPNGGAKSGSNTCVIFRGQTPR
eukprot:COSAG05_NODE_933_length_6538_cov_16.519646_1_plen_55_part_00